MHENSAPAAAHHPRSARLFAAFASLVVLALLPAAAAAAAIRPFDAGPASFRYPQGPGRTLEVTALVRGVAVVPPGAGPHPVVVVEHGRHDWCVVRRTSGADVPWRCPPDQREFRSYAGYNYLLRALAARGFAVWSVDANAATIAEDGPETNSLARTRSPQGALDPNLAAGMRFRADVIDVLLRRLAVANRGGADPFGVPLAERLDLGRVGLVGHSRGGEGVVTAADLPGGRPYRVRGIFTISPVDFARRIVPGDVALGSIVSYCDGDVSDLEGLLYLDDARRVRRTAPIWQVVVAANHDFFNRLWPDDVDDSVEESPSYCDLRSHGGRRLERRQAERVAARVVGAFMERAVAGSPGRDATLGSTAPVPRGIAGVPVVTAYVPPSGDRLDVLAPASARGFARDLLGGATHLTGFARTYRCMPPRFCAQGAQAVQGAPAYDVTWSRRGARLEAALPARVGDLSRFSVVALRAVVVPAAPNVPGRRQRFSLLLRDAAGREARVTVGADEPALRYPPPGSIGQPNLVYGAIRLPLRAFHGVDLRRVRIVGVAFDRTDAGRVLLTDLGFQR